MEDMDRIGKLPGALLPWYEQNKRELPWRADREPYHVWLSEIMLQQTRVEAVKGYYSRFLSALPTIEALAQCDDELLMKLWEGLGYYSRARNLKKAALTVMEKGGVFPGEYAQVLALPGIGSYTAGAICSICYDQPTPAVDGNVLRVISRITADETPIDLPVRKKQVEEQLAKVYPKEAGSFTQALMELGATVCGPNRRPECGVCPCREFCLAHARAEEERLPVKSPKKKRREEDRTVFILCCDGAYALEKRPNLGLLAGLWQFPNISGKLDGAAAVAKAEELGYHPKTIFKVLEKKHIFTHIQWNMTGVYLETVFRSEKLRWFTPEQIRTQSALPTAFRQFWEETEDV